jgi:endoglucanase
MAMNKTSFPVLLVFLGTLVCAPRVSAGVGRSVMLNQAGFPPRAPKAVYVTLPADSFIVCDAFTGAARFRGGLTLVRVNDPATGFTVARGDFSAFNTPGQWVVVAANDTSPRFVIADSAVIRVAESALKGFYFQRCGSTLTPGIAGAYAHPACHLQDGFFHATAESTGFMLATGGWHDAGDYGKYVVNAGITLGTLLMAMEYYPERFGSDRIGIPGTGNGVPDILDEARYELDWLLRMEKSDGGVFAKLTKAQFEGFVMPQNDSSPPQRAIYQISTCATGDFAAVMARAARVFRPYDSAYAAVCLDAARRAWGYLQAHPTIVPTGGFTNPPGTGTGEYGDANDADERLWAAAELFETTGEIAFHSYYVFRASSGSYVTGPMSWADVGSMAHLTYISSARSGVNAGVQSAARSALISACQALVAKREASGFHVALQPGDFTWGSNSAALNSAILLLRGFHETGVPAYESAARDQLSYVLGANGLGRSFLTGAGQRSSRQIHHRPSASDGVAEPVPGLLAGGPNAFLSTDVVLNAVIQAGTPAGLCYADSMPSFASNEIAINWNAPLVFVAGYFAGQQGGTQGVREGSTVPPAFRLEQSYPNPFNGTTRIRFSVGERTESELQVLDILGRPVHRERLGVLEPGMHEVVWEARSRQGSPLSTGVYLARISNGTNSGTCKLMLIR